MQAVILAAGKSTRTYPLTVNRPKPLLKVLDKTMMEHNLDQLHGLVDEVIIIVGFMKEAVIERFGASYKGMKLFYAEQKQQLGTGHALQAARDFLKGKFLVLNGDDLYARIDIARMIEHDYAVLVNEVDDISRFGAVVVAGDKVKELVEKPSTPVSKYANTGCYVFDPDIFSIELKKTARGEFEITDYVSALGRMGKMEFEVAKGCWLPIGYPWNYLEANVALLRMIEKSHIDKSAVIEDGVTVKGVVVVGKNTVIKSGTYIEGPVFIGDDCEVGPNAYLRPDTVLMDKVRTRAEIIDSVLMDRCTAKHCSYIGHSVIGEDVNYAAGCITADYRHDGGNNRTLVKGVKVDTGRRKLGAFIGDNVRLGIGTLIYPGRKIWPNQKTVPGQVVKEDIVD
ncbi:NTP transferase domain-containing protein [Candidatus Woesearchaeota archaeon]|nr:NTP transferase domain-containing protein [Candidatus Woesearchaeota archaeon]